MQRPSDELLVAFLDGEVDEARFAEIEAWLERDSELRTRLATLTETTLLVRDAFDEVLREPVPERLIDAAHGRTLAPPAASATVAETPVAKILAFRPRLKALTSKSNLSNPRWWISMAAAASVLGIVLGGAGGYLVASDDSQVASNSWLDNIAGYHNLFISSATGAENTVFDVPAGDEKALPVDIRIPDLKPWSLSFQGARKLVVEGKPAYQFFYNTDNKDLGPITLTVTTTDHKDLAPTFDHRDDVNLLYWRQRGHGYAIVGQANKGYMWGLSNDIAWQLKAM